MSNDINLIYWGGSGGFYLLYQLLLTQQCVCSFENGAISDEINLQDAIRKQFSFKDHKDWKKNENWPDNQTTKNLTTNKRKIYFYCNLFTGFEPSASNVLLYTDAVSQLRLQKLKGAYHWFRKEVDKKFIKELLVSKKDNLLKEVYITKYGIEKLGGISVKLQDTTNVERLSAFFDKINLPFTNENLDFMQYWKQLHPPALLKKIKIY